MFHKPFRVKTNTAIKGSDRKKLRGEVCRLYPSLSDDVVASLVPNKEEMTIMKIYTHTGQTVQVYCLNKIPIFFEIDRIVYPTVYTIWKQAAMLPFFTTWPPVLTKMTAGADLMLPGVVVRGELTPTTLGDLNKGQPCAVNLVGNRAAVAVGKTALSSSDMFDTGMRGKGVLILHTYLDHLWAHGDKSEPPIIEDLNTESLLKEINQENIENNVVLMEDSIPNHGASNEPCASLETGADFDKEGECVNAAVHKVSIRDEHKTGAQEEMTQEDNKEQENHLSVTPEEMDDLLYTCFLCALKTDVKKSDLPILTSKFFKSLQGWCPRNKSIDIKKSSYKKFSKFLQTMEKKGFIKMKALTPGVDSITTVHRDCKELRSFEVPDKPEAPEDETMNAEAGAFQPAVIVEMHSVVTQVVPLFQTSGFKKGKALTKAEVRQVITDYVKDNQLQDLENKGFIKLDPHLHDCAANKGEYLEVLRWDDLFDRVLRKMGESYSITFSGQPSVIKKGKLSPICLNVAQRSGNKKVTLIENVEAFGIDPQDLAHTVQLGVACSSSVVPLPGKGRGMQVTVQGNQINYVAQLILDKYKVPRKYVEGIQKGPKSGKK